MKTCFAILVLCRVLLAGPAVAAAVVAPGHCALCAKLIEQRVYLWEDKIAGDTKNLCEACAPLPACYLCSLPTGTDRTLLTDGRVLCPRDTKLAVLDSSEALKICKAIQDALDRHFSRFTSFPEKNVSVNVVDRVNLIELFKIPGQDYGCPNILGFTKPETNATGRGYQISLMSGLTRPELKATCAHELGHAWIFENVSPARIARLQTDAREGFCELVAFLLMHAQSETTATALIRSNAYTRGQIDLFIAAEQRYGFNEIVEWMKAGEDDSLRADDLTRVRRLQASERTNAPAAQVFFPPAAPPPAPDQLLLQGIIWAKTRPMVMINGRTFAANEEASVRLGPTNVVLRCLVIRQDEVEIQVAGASERQTLRMKGR